MDERANRVMMRRRWRAGDRAPSRAGLGLLALLAVARPAAATEPPLLERWRLSPIYSSTYDVRRQETSWWQKLDLDRKGGLADLKSALEVKSREDPSRNAYHESDNRFGLKLGRKVDLGELTLDGDWRRRWTEDVRSVTAIDEDHMNLGSTVGLLGRERSTLDFRFSGGWLRGRELKERQVGTLRTIDRTFTSGLEGETFLQGQWEPVKDLKVGSRASWDGSVQSSDSRHVEADETTLYTARDHARTLDFDSTLEWTRHAEANVSLEAKMTDGFAQYYQATRQAQETKSRRSHSVELHVEGEPMDSLAYAVDLTTDMKSFDYRVETSDKLDSDRSGRYSAEYRPHLPLLRGGSLRGALELGRHRTENQNTADYTTHSKSVEAEFQRPFGPRFVLDLRGTETLAQDIYDNMSLDKDRLRSDSFYSLTYDRGEPFRALASYATSRTEDVNIPRGRAGQNQVQDDYRITFDYQGKLPAQIALRQNYQISATYTYYVFNPDKNTLTRTNRVTTKVDVPLWANSGLYLEHIYLRSDNGLYVYSAVTGARGYSVGAENLRQYLSAVARYRFLGMFEAKVTQSFNIEMRQAADGTNPTRREKLTLSGLLALHRQVRGLQLDASFERTSSNTEEDYWTIDASVEKQFN
jgi:hypothetical protein